MALNLAKLIDSRERCYQHIDIPIVREKRVMLKTIALYLATNLAVIFIISIILSIFNVSPYLTQHGLNYQSLLIFALIVGFTGSFFSLMISKWMAMRAFNIQLITQPKNAVESWLYSSIKQMSQQRGIGMPEIGIYASDEPNAFATGWNRNHALVAVSTGLLNSMSQDEVAGVLGHEISHVANGDMVTMTLLQGVVNTFVIFFARIAAFFVAQFFSRDGEQSEGGGIVYNMVAIFFQLIFGIFATMIVMWFSRHREYRADAGSAQYVGRDKMVHALQRLGQVIPQVPEDDREPAFNTMKIAGYPNHWTELFASHPPIEKRIAALQQAG